MLIAIKWLKCRNKRCEGAYFLHIEGIVWHFGKYAYSYSSLGWDWNIDTFSCLYGKYVPGTSSWLASFGLKTGNSVSPALFKGNKISLAVPVKAHHLIRYILFVQSVKTIICHLTGSYIPDYVLALSSCRVLEVTDPRQKVVQIFIFTLWFLYGLN